MWPTILVARNCGAEAIVVRRVDDGGSRRRKRTCKLPSDMTKPGQLSTSRASAIVAAGLNLLSADPRVESSPGYGPVVRNAKRFLSSPLNQCSEHDDARQGPISPA